MKEIVRENIVSEYSLHDMNIIEMIIKDKNLILKTQSGIIRCESKTEQIEGYVKFINVDWDFSNVYIMDISKNEGKFKGEKMEIKTFLSTCTYSYITVIDEVYGYNKTKYMGYITTKNKMKECLIEIYHLGDMVFIEE